MEKKKPIFVGAPVHQAIKEAAVKAEVSMYELAERILIKGLAAMDVAVAEKPRG